MTRPQRRLVMFPDSSVDDSTAVAERMAVVRTMAAEIAHEIRNPLVAIKTYIELLPERCTCVSQGEQQEFTIVALRAIEQILALLERLAEMRGGPSARLEPLDLRDVLGDALLLLQNLLAQETVTVVQELGTGCFVLGDYGQLSQLFVNLLTNAKEAVSAGGRIRARCWVRQEHGRPMVVVEISDTGPGIPADVRETLFEPFVTTKANGTGLGLAICRAIANRHRATIRACSDTPGIGATVTVELPAWTA